MKAEMKLFDGLEKSVDEFFARNPTDEEKQLAIQATTALLEKVNYAYDELNAAATMGLKYVLARLKEA